MSVVEDFLNVLQAWTGKKVPRHVYLQIDEVKQKACSDGLLEEDIHKLVKNVVTRKLPNKGYLEILHCLIPKTTVSKDSVKLLLGWVTSNFIHISDSVIVAALQWTCCLLEFELTDKQAVNDFYVVFFFLLTRKNLIPLACRIIYFLTKSDDVTRWSVTHVLATEKITQGLKKPAFAVLNLFKSFRPECVPEDVPPVSTSVVFRQLPDVLQLYFGRAQQRNEARQAPKGEELHWRTLASANRKKRKFCRELIPPVDYVNIGPSMYQDKTTHYVLKYSSFEELCSYQLSLAMPSNIMSLLANHAGRHIIAFGNLQLQSRFSYLLFNKLYDVLILKAQYSTEEIEECLSYLVNLQEYMQQGVPIVSKVLSEYIILWDGAEFQDLIFCLLEWVAIKSYEDLYDCVLHHLRNSFLLMDGDQRCAMIRMFRRLVTNMYMSILYRNRQSFEKPFLTCHEEWNAASILEKVVSFVHEELIVLGFSQFFDDYLFVEEVLTFCETVQDSVKNA
ncbi:centromere protein I-like isoform X2 [Bacillus rossius redtenbacheri]|uniref:centromere protein I-like isoform X2 n=1 Tax=Bacillus rossius redtenbacheri TaxID=93214 RepID=UPI002FDE6314